jgi:predicted amidophosphoribosyltransferase
MECPECHSVIRNDATFCDACGAELLRIPAGRFSQEQVWRLAVIALVLSIATGVVWFFWVR